MSTLGSRQRRALHDLFAHSLVVRLDADCSPRWGARSGGGRAAASAALCARESAGMRSLPRPPGTSGSSTHRLVSS
jgi:hypothetical protein